MNDAAVAAALEAAMRRAVDAFTWRITQLTFFEIWLLAIFAVVIPPTLLFATLILLGIWDDHLSG